MAAERHPFWVRVTVCMKGEESKNGTRFGHVSAPTPKAEAVWQWYRSI